MYPFGYWLRKYLKVSVYRDPITSLSDFIEMIEHHVRNIPQFILPSIEEHTFLRFQI